MLPFLMLYRRQALLIEQMPYISYASISSYKVALGNHFRNMIYLNQEAQVWNQQQVVRSKEYFKKMFAKKSRPHMFVEGYIVLMSIIKKNKGYQERWNTLGWSL